MDMFDMVDGTVRRHWRKMVLLALVAATGGAFQVVMELGRDKRMLIDALRLAATRAEVCESGEQW